MTSLRFLQTPFWAEFKENHGWKALYFSLDGNNKLSKLDSYGTSNNSDNSLTVLIRCIKGFSLAYIPMAPEFKGRTDPSLPVSGDERNAYLEKLFSLAENLKPFLPKRTLFIRFDPPVDFTDIEYRSSFAHDPVPKNLHIKKSHVDVQPPDTVLLSLEKSEEEILSEMKSKWRYNIRLAGKKGVEVSRHYATDADFEDAFEAFYNLFEQTSKRDGVSFHGKAYYKDLLERGIPSEDESKPKITLYLAKHENDCLAGIITLFCEREAVYLYGASGNIKRNLMPAYLLQWTAIQDAKKEGCPVYDFYGCPPTDDENHPMHGLFLFKTGFGGKLIHRPGSFDIPTSALYGFYDAAEKLRAWWHRKALKKLGGH
ncbi:MAG: peptidoglycan bridge formation glycyltransferase FemA/FemB family protein [Treponema sp.]|nr:peptidoglycan bridge formation glycyltransferase FemA/FemB family protein [Treponema sp.]